MAKPAPRGERVLLVEDDPDSAEAIRVLLEYEGYAVEWVATGRAAFERLDRGSAAGPALRAVLLDLGLPDLSEEALLREIEQRAQRLPPLLVLSAAPVDQIRRVASAIRARVALRKPCDATALLSALGQLGDESMELDEAHADASAVTGRRTPPHRTVS